MTTTHYETLEVSPEASAEVIRAAYRSLSAKYHPDKDDSPDASQRLQQVQVAYSVLSDPRNRAEYDKSLGKEQCSEDQPDVIVMRLDGTSTFLTLSEHVKRGGKELAGCDLRGLNLSNTVLRRAQLEGAKLDGSSFRNCDLQDANLTDCSAVRCDFDGAKLSGATLTRTNFTGSSMVNTLFFQVGAVIGTTQKSEHLRFNMHDTGQKTVDQSVMTALTVLHESCFSECDLRGATFAGPQTKFSTGTVQKEVWLGRQDIPFYTRQTFQSPAIKSCRFVRSNLHEIDLHGVALQGCDFSGSNLHGANLVATNIEDVDFSDCNLVNADLHKVGYNSATKLPEGYRLPDDAIDFEALRLATAAQQKQEGTFEILAWLVIGVIALFLIAGMLTVASG